MHTVLACMFLQVLAICHYLGMDNKLQALSLHTVQICLYASTVHLGMKHNINQVREAVH